MTLIHSIKASASRLMRGAAGVALGLGFVGALLSPCQALAQAAAPAATPQAQGAGPALWVIRDPDSTIYLFGTVHVLRPTTGWGSAKVDTAFNAASEIYFEIENPADQAAVAPLIQRYGVNPQGGLAHTLTAGQLTLLDSAARSMGMTAVQMDVFRPWLAGLTLSMAPLTKAGYDPNSGVELVLRQRALAAGKPVKGLETLEQQIQFLATLPEPTQVAFLRSTLESYEDATTELDALVAAWAAGDVAAVQRLGVDEIRQQGGGLYRVLLTDRNTDWAGQIQRMLAGSGTTFIAVGAAHLAGPDSVQAILQKRGVTVQTVN